MSRLFTTNTDRLPLCLLVAYDSREHDNDSILSLTERGRVCSMLTFRRRLGVLGVPLCIMLLRMLCVYVSPMSHSSHKTFRFMLIYSFLIWQKCHWATQSLLHNNNGSNNNNNGIDSNYTNEIHVFGITSVSCCAHSLTHSVEYHLFRHFPRVIFSVLPHFDSVSLIVQLRHRFEECATVGDEQLEPYRFESSESRSCFGAGKLIWFYLTIILSTSSSWSPSLLPRLLLWLLLYVNDILLLLFDCAISVFRRTVLGRLRTVRSTIQRCRSTDTRANWRNYSAHQ